MGVRGIAVGFVLCFFLALIIILVALSRVL